MKVPSVKETVGLGDTWAEPRASRSAARGTRGSDRSWRRPPRRWEPREGDRTHGDRGAVAEAIVRAVSVVEVLPLGKPVFEFRVPRSAVGQNSSRAGAPFFLPSVKSTMGQPCGGALCPDELIVRWVVGGWDDGVRVGCYIDPYRCRATVKHGVATGGRPSSPRKGSRTST